MIYIFLHILHLTTFPSHLECLSSHLLQPHWLSSGPAMCQLPCASLTIYTRAISWLTILYFPLLSTSCQLLHIIDISMEMSLLRKKTSYLTLS